MTGASLQPMGGGRGWWRCPGCWRGARIRQREGAALHDVALGWAPSHGTHRRAGLGQGSATHPAHILQGFPSPQHPPHGVTLGARVSHHVSPRSSRSTYLWSPGSCRSAGAGKALRADLAPNARGSFSSLCSAGTLGGIRCRMSQRGSQGPISHELQTGGRAGAWDSPTLRGRSPPRALRLLSHFSVPLDFGIRLLWVNTPQPSSESIPGAA